MKLVWAAVISFGVLAAAVILPQLREVFGTVLLERSQMLTALAFSAAVPFVSGLMGMFHVEQK